MAHAQQQVLDRLQALLIAGATVAAANVFVDRVDPVQPVNLPAILITEGDGGEQAEIYGMDGSQKRTLAITVDCLLTHSTTAAADARAFGLAVEKLIAADNPLRAMCSLGLAIQSSSLLISGDSDRLLATRQQQWSFSYVVQPTAPDSIL